MFLFLSALDVGKTDFKPGANFFKHIKIRFLGIIESFELAGSLKGHPVQLPCYEQRHL